MESPATFLSLHTNQRLLANELQARGVLIEVVDAADEILMAHYEGHTELLLDRDSSITPIAASLFCGDKYQAKKWLMRFDIPVPKGTRFNGHQSQLACDFALALQKPVVIKPCFGSHGDHVHIGLSTYSEIKKAIDSIRTAIGEDTYFLIEEYCLGNEYRVFLTRAGKYAVLLREPACVFGDGVHTIRQLIWNENERRTNPRTNCLCPLREDDRTQEALSKRGFTLDAIPMKGLKVQLAENSNITTGGMCMDVTDLIHPKILEIASRALKAFPGLPYAGFDFLTTSIDQAPDEGSLKLLEVNSNPGFHMHHAPGQGISRNVASMVADLIFPETQ